MSLYEFEPAYSPRFDSFGRPRDARLTRPSNGQASTSLSSSDVHLSKPPQAIVLLTPRSQPTVMWPVSPLDANPYHSRNLAHRGPPFLQPQQAFLAPPPPTYCAPEPDPLANYRRFPHASPLPSHPPVQPIASVIYDPSQQPMLIPCEEFTPRNYSNTRKTLWKPRLTNKVQMPRDFQPRAIMPRSPNNSYANSFQPASVSPNSLEQKAICSTHSPHFSPLSCGLSSPGTHSSAPIALPPLSASPAKERNSLAAIPPSIPLCPLDASTKSSLFDQPTSPSSTTFATPGVQKRRKKQTKTDNLVSVSPVSNSWTIMSWKSSRWLLSHEKAVVRLLLCLLLVGAFVLAMMMDSKPIEVIVEAENWSRPRYDWIDNL